MNATETIFPCAICNRQFLLADGEWSLAERLTLHPAWRECGQADCGAAAARFSEKLQADAHRELNRFNKALENHRDRHRGKAECRQAARVRSDSTPPVRLGRLPYSDAELPELLPEPRPLTQSVGEAFVRGGVVEDIGPSHQAAQAVFSSGAEGADDCERMLELLIGAYPDFQPEGERKDLRTAASWIPNHVLIGQHKILTPHSRASQLRGSRTLTPHPLVRQFDLDIDCRPRKEHGGAWCYSICHKEHSLRLQAESRDSRNGKADRMAQ